MRMKDLAVGVKDLFMVDPCDLVIAQDWNVRQKGPDYEAHIQSLMASIREVGVLEPFTVYLNDKKQIVVTNGHCRHDAVTRLIAEGVEIKAVPARTEERTANDADRVLSMLTRNGGMPLSPLEQGMVMKRLIAFGWEVNDIARKVGKTPSYVNQLLDLTAAPTEVLSMVADGSISASTAARTLRKEGAEQAVQTLKTAKAAAGDKKVTPKMLKKPSAEAPAPKEGPNWASFGPKLQAAIEAIRDAEGPAREKAILQAIGLVETLEAAS